MKDVRTRKKHLLFLPVRRKLAAFTISYLAGIYLSKSAALPAAFTGMLCALLLLGAAVRLKQRRGALFCFACAAALAGNLYGNAELNRRDLPTGYGVQIEGIVYAIQDPYRILLSDVMVDGERKLNRPAVVTLMKEEEQPLPQEPLVGQRISGIGRLFAPDEKRNPGGVEERIRTICDGYELSGYILPGWAASGEPEFSFREWFRKGRTYYLAQIEAVFGSNAPFFQGIMLGDKHALDESFASALRLTGSMHLMTVSGMHLSMVAMLLRVLLNCMPLSRKAEAAIIGIFLACFVVLTGGSPGTIRACMMTMMREWAAIRGRQYDALTSLSFAALVMVVVRPLWVFDVSFRFSFLVVLGIILMLGGMNAWLDRHAFGKGMLNALVQVGGVSICAQTASLPMQMLLYGYIPVLALPMNVLGAMLIPVLMAAGWLCVLLSWVSMPAAGILAWPVSAVAVGFEQISIWLSQTQGCIVRLPAPTETTVILCFAVLIITSRSILFGRCRTAAALLLALLAVSSYLPRLDPSARYVQLDVGQGDAAVIRNGRHAVISDVGPSGSYDMLRYIRHEGLFVDAVILSHLDQDHAGALSVMLDSEIHIPAIVMAEGAMDGEVASEVTQALDDALQRGIPIHTLHQGDRMQVCGIDMQVLSPSYDIVGSNDRSLLIRAQLNDISILLTGDLPQSSEPVSVPACDILKVAHHGSKNATSDAFVHQVHPEIALISVGANSYGHPSKRVLETLEGVGAQVMRTDTSGCVSVRLERGRLKPEGFLP